MSRTIGGPGDNYLWCSRALHWRDGYAGRILAVHMRFATRIVHADGSTKMCSGIVARGGVDVRPLVLGGSPNR
jgi:hypothetical protein